MPQRINLKVTKGQLSGQEFPFEQRSICILGRGTDCCPRIPDDDAHLIISRHHCLLDINPPDIRIRDFGSLNGTYVNGYKIGQRHENQNPEDVASEAFPEYDLQNGDLIDLGDTQFVVNVYVPAYCEVCDCELEESNRAAANLGGGHFQCGRCQSAARENGREVLPESRVCALCNKSISRELGSRPGKEFVCSSCQNDPVALVRHLMELAKTGKDELAAIRGYSIERELGRGGMGAVYLAHRENTGEQVALKVMLPKVAADARAKEFFLREVENTKALNHRNVVQLRDSGCSEGTFFFTIEYCDGGSVDHWMARNGGILTPSKAIPIILDVLEGLHYAHHAPIPHVKLKNGIVGRGKGLVHRDLSPQNIFLLGEGGSQIAKIGDYGLSKAFDLAGLSGQTMTGATAGKPYFMPRQQVINHRFAKPEVDVWAAAATLYNMLTGAFPRTFQPGHDVWQTILCNSAVPILERNPSIPKSLAKVIDHALEDNPSIGFQTAREFQSALKAAL